MSFEEELPQAPPYLPPSQPPRPMMIESRMPSERPSTIPARKRQEARNRMRTWFILGGGMLLGVILIVVKL